MKITIKDELKTKNSDFNIAVMQCEVEIKEDRNIDVIINKLEENISKNIAIEDVVNLDIIIDGRNAYKSYGKDPSRYRLAVESLYRRISKGNKLYRINNIVDLGNILSIETRKSVAVLDYNKIIGDISIRLGKNTDVFIGIGRGRLNIENIPVYVDDIGPFGSTTSDTERTMITNKTTKILLFIISFKGKIDLEKELIYAKKLYTEFASGKSFTSYII